MGAKTVLSLEILVASDFGKVARIASNNFQYHYMYFLRIIRKAASGSYGSNRRYCRPPTLVDYTAKTLNGVVLFWFLSHTVS